MSKRKVTKAIKDFRDFLKEMSAGMEKEGNKKEPGELKEIFKATVFTYDFILEETDRYFEPLGLKI